MNRSLIFFILLTFLLTKPVWAVQTLNIDSTSVNMGIVTASDFENGYKEKLSGNTLSVTSDASWKVLVKTNGNNMGVIGDYTKLISDFYWKAGSSYATQTTYTSIANYDIEVARGNQGSGLSIPVDYKILLSWSNDVPGNYNLTVIYTLTTQ